MNAPLDIFVIQSPLQFLAAREARDVFGGTPAKTRLLLMHDHRGVEALIDPVEWPDVVLNDHGFGPWTIAERRRCSEAVLGAPQRIFLGDYLYDQMRHLALVSGAETVVLDDGAATHNRTAAFRKARRVSWKSRAKRLLCGLRCGHPAALTFFTTYNDLEPGPDDRVVRNPWRRLAAGWPAQGNGETWFLGRPFVAEGWMAAEAYAEILARARRRFSPLVYKPHRRENPGTTAEPVELAAAGKGPSRVVAPFSSALDVLAACAPPWLELVALRPPAGVWRHCEARRVAEANLARHARGGRIDVVAL